MLHTDVLVVGGGPAGASVATWLARSGQRVTLLEKRPLPRHKACGDALTPRALRELARLGVDPIALGGHSVTGVRMVYRTRELEVPWPEHDSLPDHGAVVRRDVLDEHLRQRAADAGAEVLMGHEAITSIVERGFIRGATVAIHDDSELPASAGAGQGMHSTTPDGQPGETRDIRARFVVVADGANSSFGRGLGTTRQRDWPYGIATRSYWESPRHDEPWIESVLSPTDQSGKGVAGYGWVIPLGDGTVNAGIAMLSTYRDVKGVNALKMLDSFADRIADRWNIEPASKLKAPTRFRVPLGGSVGPKMGPTFLVVGDAAGVANPFNGDGVDAALLSGRLAAEVIAEALTTGNSTTLQRYPTVLAEEVGQYHKVGRLAARFIGRPGILRPALQLGMRSPRVMGSALRIATNELRDDGGGAERAYALANAITRFAPNW